ncbi:hypothetical protein [Singulisphaera acidiphila]|uniref:Uncharacterized protein n=1 Tax=Singulisphaera acidiphila (strain ATCC BAA-1392 / DSM 18658 / VKM B-2454 / MOB10) TaxID=886293 RepID=L0D8Z6_SINAD|nr:hypothetical protein [Singulisphaera acidiphila]AGA25116.1 hypothetical protein Sinac_0704 [Singulisphaera acidiphila DSM 18658]
MWSHRTGSSRRNRQRYAAWAALAIGWLLPSVGCQVEYAGMTLPSGKYMHDDVQYFAPGPNFPMANSQAAAQRARMQAMGLEPNSIGPVAVPPAPGSIPAVQNQLGRPTDVNASPLSVEPPVGSPVTPPAPDSIVPPDAVPPPPANP